MNARGTALVRGAVVAVAAIAYAVLAHQSNLAPAGHTLGVVLAAGPPLLLAVLLAWRTAYRVPCLLACALAVVLAYRYWEALTQQLVWISLAPQASAYVALGILFGRSLLRGRTPLCTRWATAVHGPLPPAVVAYTRKVTGAWAVFFGLMTTALIALGLFAPAHVWSAFANFCTFPLIAAMFVAEYIVRGRVLPDMQHAGILEGARAYLESSRDAAAPRGR